MLYENCQFQAPDGEPIFLQSRKSAEWYLRKGLANLVCEEPFTVRLIKEPKGRGRAGDPFYMTPRVNECVVCGSTDRLTRHHVVPQFFRKHFPLELKASSNHDVLAACESCHRAYCVFEDGFKKELASEAGLNSRGISLEIPAWALKAATMIELLLAKEDLSEQGRLNLIRKLSSLLPKELTSELVSLLVDIILLQKSSSLGRQLVDRLDREGLITFSKRWRRHFVNSMNPQFLPAYWDPEREEP